MWYLSLLKLSLCSLSKLAFPGVCVYLFKKRFFFQEQALELIQSPPASQLWSLWLWEADLGSPSCWGHDGGHALYSQTVRVQGLFPLLTSCLTLESYLSSLCFNFPTCRWEKNSTYLIGLILILKS